jgi:hypothetical protein
VPRVIETIDTLAVLTLVDASAPASAGTSSRTAPPSSYR